VYWPTTCTYVVGLHVYATRGRGRATWLTDWHIGLHYRGTVQCCWL